MDRFRRHHPLTDLSRKSHVSPDSHHAFHGIFLVAALIACLCIPCVCRATDSPRPNVLLITMDTTRADHLGAWGHADAKTPVLDRLTREGVLFQQCRCTVPLTLPSHISIMTGRNPPSHGIAVNGAGILPDSIPVLAGILKDAGYHTGAFVSSAVLKRLFGLNRGFDRYDDAWSDGGGGDRERSERPADQVADSLLEWLETETGTPFLAWAHFYDPHNPYNPPEVYVKAGLSRYDGEITSVDRQISRILTRLARDKRLDDTLVIIAGDHGEAFGEHREIRHGFFIYDTTAHVPCILWNPRLLSSRIHNKIQISKASLADLMPTILDILDLPIPNDTDGKSLVSETTHEPRGECYLESRYPQLGFGWAPLHGIVKDNWKYIEAPQPELYDLAVDPGETNNRIDSAEDTARHLRSDLNRMMSRMTTMNTQPAQMDETTRQQLESLGYLAGAAGGKQAMPDDSRRDPKTMVDVYSRYIDVRSLLKHGHTTQAIALLKDLVAESPESGNFHCELGKALFDSGQPAEAIPELQAGLKITAPNPMMMTTLGDALERNHQTEEALRIYSDILRRFPRYSQAWSRLGIIHTQRGEFQAAHDCLKKATELDPHSATAFANFGNSMIRFHRYEEAAGALEHALALQPAFPAAHKYLWLAYSKMHQTEKARDALENAHRILPSNVMITDRLAWYLSTNPDPARRDPARAITLAESCIRREPGRWIHRDVLAAACAAAGDFARAEESAERALEMAGRPEIRKSIMRRLSVYRQEKPWIAP